MTEPFMKDWSQGWQPLPTKITPHKDVKVNVHPYHVTEADIAEFQERGYWISPKIIDDQTIELLRQETTRVYQGELDYQCAPYEYDWWIKSVTKHMKNDPGVRKINNAWYINAAYRSLATNHVIGDIAAHLLHTDEVRLWHDQAIWKPSEDKNGTEGLKGNIGWHQDYGFWQISDTSNMCTAWIPLQDVDVKNGAMRTLVGSHKWGLIKHSARFFDQDLDKLKTDFQSVVPGPWVDEPCVMKAGQVVFHHALTFHASGPNHSDKPRLAAALHLMPRGTGYAPGRGHHHNLKDLGPHAHEGMLFTGDRFPLLFRKRDSKSMDYP